jgi:hypothetical protein
MIGTLASAAVALPASRATEQKNLPVETKSPNGGQARVLTLTEQLLHSTIMIRSKNAKGETSSGTGFVFNLFNHNEQSVPVLVSNKRVVRGAIEGALVFTEATADNLPNYGSNISFQITEFSQAWIEHPDTLVDLSILPLVPFLTNMSQQGKRPYFIALDQTIVPTEEGYKNLTPLEDILVIGYPDGISDTKNNVPVFRRGITATPVYLDFLGKKEFLVDAAIFPGSSGSPVFLYNQGTWANRDGSTALGSRVQLLGVIYAVALHTTDGDILIVPAPTQAKSVARSQIPNNLGLCIKASRILEFEPILVQRGFKVPDGYKMRIEHL